MIHVRIEAFVVFSGPKKVVLQYSINFRQKYLTKSYAVKMTELDSFEESDADLTSTRRACRQNSLLHFAHIQHLAEPSKSTRARLGVLSEANPSALPFTGCKPPV